MPHRIHCSGAYDPCPVPPVPDRQWARGRRAGTNHLSEDDYDKFVRQFKAAF